MIFGSASATRRWLAARPARLGELQVRGAALVPASGQRPPGAPDGPVTGQVADTAGLGAVTGAVAAGGGGRQRRAPPVWPGGGSGCRRGSIACPGPRAGWLEGLAGGLPGIRGGG